MRLAHPIVALVLLTVLHGLVDTFALFIQPLWPTLERQVAADSLGMAVTYGLFQLANSGSQLFWGYLGDRYQGRWLLWAGPLAGMVCMSCLGLATSVVALNGLLIVGGLGIAAFHPEAAALAGRLTPEHRSRAMSIFAVGGYLGQAIGPYLSGEITADEGATGLVWNLRWGLVLLLVVSLGLRRASQVDHHVRSEAVSLGRLLHGRGGAVVLLMSVGILRVVTSVGVPLALSYLIQEVRHGTTAQTGHVQSAFQFGIGLGSVLCAALISRHNERFALWAPPLLSTPLLCLACTADEGTMAIYMTLAGICMGVSLPVVISYGQQLLPEGPRVASSLTMGMTWGVGSLIVAVAMVLFRQGGDLDGAVYAFAAAGAVSSLLCLGLPDLRRATL